MKLKTQAGQEFAAAGGKPLRPGAGSRLVRAVSLTLQGPPRRRWRSVAIAAAMLELLSGSIKGAASDGAAIDTILRAGAVLAFVGAIGLFAFGRAATKHEPAH
jgi:hypothetical protein